ncbi:MAG: xanthine dehydrogenase family protein molybdopterin-binding subunit [Nocardioidaceae bacterium]|nr:xanthine dehydrogenase family protein molybdopterin-binding subunit [Nocardioidaceae bacterium]
MSSSILGTTVRRVEDRVLLQGRGDYVDNQRPPGVAAAHAVFVRSPIAHARITALDVSAARALPGVLEVFTADELGTDLLPAFGTANEACRRAALASEKVRYVGDPVALVVAETRAQAVDAADAVEIDYEPLPVVTDPEQALTPDAALQFEELGTNVASRRTSTQTEDPLAGADHVVRVRMVNQRIATAPIEGHAILVDPVGERTTCWISTQNPHGARDILAAAAGVPPDQLRVIAPHVGGAFGGKAGANADHGAVLRAARLLSRAVRWTETRSESMLSMQGRGQIQYAELGLSTQGTITGLRLRMIGECGAYAGFGGGFATGSTYLMSQGPYEIPALRYDGIAVMTNTAPTGAFRGAGRPEAAACLERVLDVAAAEVGLTPEEIRRRNLIAADRFPYPTHSGLTYDNGDYRHALEVALRTAGIDELRAEQHRRRAAGEHRLLGIGISTYVEITGFASTEFGGVQVHADGRATVRAGTSSHGQGHATSFAMIVSDQLGIPLDQIEFVQSDTDLVPTGGGTGGSRSLQIGGSAVASAAQTLHRRALELAADLFEAAAADVCLEAGRFTVLGVPDHTLTWADVASHAEQSGAPLDIEADFDLKSSTFPFGAHVAVVEVDAETGHVTPLRLVAVDDCGRILNPLLVAGQQHGGALQGMSQALWEEMLYDGDGNPITSSFADYAIPTAADAISFEVSNTETPTPANPLGAKGIGESATVGSTPAVQNAVIDALSHLGVRHLDLPCTPQRIWRALEQARTGTLPDLWREPPNAF